MNKRLLSVFIVLCMIFTLLPVSSKRALAADGDPVSYNIWVGGVQVTSANQDNITGPGIAGTVTYTPATQTLTVSGAAITGAYTGAQEESSDVKSAIYAEGAMNIVLIGDNTVTGVSESGIFSHGIYTTGALAISGTGSLAVSGGSAAVGYGIRSLGNIVISSGTVTAFSGNAVWSSAGIRGYVVTISGGTVSATANATSAYGILANANLGSPYGINITGGTVIASSNVFGCGGSLPTNISGGTVTISGDSNARASSGTFTYSDATVSASTNKNGDGSVTYVAANIATYKYLKYEPLPASTTPTADTTTVTKTSATQQSIDFTLTNSPAYSDSQTWKVYTGSTGDTLATGVTASNTGNTLTLAHSTDVPAATYYVSVTEDNKAKSARLPLTVGAYVPALTGTVTISGTPKFEQTLTATYASGNNTGTLSYHWKREGNNIGTNSDSYTLVEADLSKTITCEVTSTVQTGSVTSDATTAIAKADGSTVTGVSAVGCTNSNNNDGKLTGVTSAMQYKQSGAASYTDGSGNDITGLTNGTYLVRVKETSTHNAGEDRTFTVGAYVPGTLTGTVTISGTPKFGQTLTATYASGNNTGTLSYQWKREGNNIGTNLDSYTLVEADVSKTITCEVTSSVQTGSVASDATTATVKADGPAVTGVAAVGCTTESNNDGKLTGMTTAMEYKKISDASYTAVSSSAISVTGSAITGLTNGDYLVRIAETDTHCAGTHSTFTVASFIPDPTYTISGTIQDRDTNSGIAGAVLQLKSGSGNIGSAVSTNSSGAYTISDVPAGTYAIEVSAADYDSGTISSVGVSDANVTDQNLRLTKTVTFIPITDITMTNGASVQVNTNLTLTGTMTPGNATNRTMIWSVENANGTGASITGNTFHATSAGTATVKATIANGLTASSDYTKTFTITVTAVPTSTPSSTEKPEGSVEKTQQQNDGAPAVILNNSVDELKASVLTPAEKEMVARGDNAQVILKVTDIGASVSDEEKKLINEQLSSENSNTGIPVLYVDLSLYKKVGSQEQTKVTETSGKIRISLEVPESFWNTDVTKSREFYVVRIHDGVVTKINGSYDPVTHLFTFETDKFSTYAMSYQDTSLIQTYYDFRHLHLKVQADKTSQTLSYKRIANVDGYLIYGGKCGEEMTKLAELPANITSYTVENLKQGIYYKYQVKAYRIIDGAQVIIMTSKVVHSATEGKTYANPTKVTSDTASVKLTVGDSKAVICQVVLPKGKKMKEHTADIRYESSNKAIATVSSKGKITAKAKGTCYVYAYAQNGVYKMIKVIVE